MKQEKSNKNIINRKKFLIYTGTAVAGAYALLKNPFQMLKIKPAGKSSSRVSGSSSVKVSLNPNSVMRNSLRDHRSKGNNG